jgi:hypothetical protein
MRLRIIAALAAAMLLTASLAVTVSAHNAGCVQTGTGTWVFVGSNKEGPVVPEQNPNKVWDPAIGDYRLDLQPENAGGDQFGARAAADVGGSAVERPLATRCLPPEPRSGFAP